MELAPNPSDSPDLLDETLSRFPFPISGQSSSPGSRWQTVKEKIADKEKEKKKWVNLVKSAQSNTKSFLGIDASTGNNNLSGSVEASRSLINWNERVFKVMNNNRFFGGQLKEKRLDEYIEQLNEDVVDNTNPFLFYKMTGGSQIELVPKKITVANMAMDGIKKLTKRNKKDEVSKVRAILLIFKKFLI